MPIIPAKMHTYALVMRLPCFSYLSLTMPPHRDEVKPQSDTIPALSPAYIFLFSGYIPPKKAGMKNPIAYPPKNLKLPAITVHLQVGLTKISAAAPENPLKILLIPLPSYFFFYG